METEQENRPVFMTGASVLLTLDMRLPGARSAEPCARAPPTLRRGVTSAASRAFDGRATATRQGIPPHMQGRKQREAMRQHRLSRNAGLAKLVPVTASYVTR